MASLPPPPLTGRWQMAAWSDGEYSAALPNYRDGHDTITLTLETLSGGQCAYSVVGRNGKELAEGTSANKEAAAQDCLRATVEHLRASRTDPHYLLGFMPWTTEQQIGRYMEASQSAINQWRRNKKKMSTRYATIIAKLAGLHGFARGYGELWKLLPPYWESPEYCAQENHSPHYLTGKAGRKAGAAWRGKKSLDL